MFTFLLYWYSWIVACFEWKTYFTRRQYFVSRISFQMAAAIRPKINLYIIILKIKFPFSQNNNLPDFCTEQTPSVVNPRNAESSADISQRLSFIESMFIIFVLPSTVITPEIWPNWSYPDVGITGLKSRCRVKKCLDSYKSKVYCLYLFCQRSSKPPISSLVNVLFWLQYTGNPNGFHLIGGKV